MAWSSFFKSVGNMAMMGITGYEVGRQALPDEIIVQVPEVPKENKNIESEHNSLNIYVIVLITVLFCAIFGIFCVKACKILNLVKRQNDIELHSVRTGGRIPRPQPDN